MHLIINGKIINTKIEDILYQVQRESNTGLLTFIGDDVSDNVLINCPFHKDGKEQHPSGRVYTNDDNDKVVYGTFHCFTCNTSCQLFTLINVLFGVDKYSEFGKEWLVERFGSIVSLTSDYLTDIEIEDKQLTKNNYLDKSILNEYRYFHPYLQQRKLSMQITQYFDVGWDRKLNAITFPLFDENDNLLGISKRMINTKQYIIPTGIRKPIYLFNYVKKLNVSSLVVCESQINALYSWSLGHPAVALLGTGVTHQYELLKRSGIRVFYLAFDGDTAGRKGCKRFIDNMNNDCMINILDIPNGKDLNDLSPEQVERLFIKISDRLS